MQRKFNLQDKPKEKIVAGRKDRYLRYCLIHVRASVFLTHGQKRGAIRVSPNDEARHFLSREDWCMRKFIVIYTLKNIYNKKFSLLCSSARLLSPFSVARRRVAAVYPSITVR
jgi:hypothetical protein